MLIKLGEHADDFGAEESWQPRLRLASGESDMMKLALAGDVSVLPPPASPASRVGVGAGGRPDSGASGNAQFFNELRESDRAETEPNAEETRKENGQVEAEAGLAVSLVQSAIAGALENMFAFGIGTIASAHTAPTSATHTNTDTDTDTQHPADTSVSDSAQSDSGGAAERAGPSSQSPPPAATRQNPQKLSEQSPSHLGVLREDEEPDV